MTIFVPIYKTSLSQRKSVSKKELVEEKEEENDERVRRRTNVFQINIKISLWENVDQR